MSAPRHIDQWNRLLDGGLRPAEIAELLGLDVDTRSAATRAQEFQQRAYQACPLLPTSFTPYFVRIGDADLWRCWSDPARAIALESLVPGKLLAAVAAHHALDPALVNEPEELFMVLRVMRVLRR